jgi:hypothetical protein
MRLELSSYEYVLNSSYHQLDGGQHDRNNAVLTYLLLNWK